MRWTKDNLDGYLNFYSVSGDGNWYWHWKRAVRRTIIKTKQLNRISGHSQLSRNSQLNSYSTISQSLYNWGRVTIWTLVKTSLWWNDELRLKFDQPLRWTISYSMSFVFVGQDIMFLLLFPSSFSFIDDDDDPSGKPFHIPCLPFRIPFFSCSLVKIWSFRCFFSWFSDIDDDSDLKLYFSNSEDLGGHLLNGGRWEQETLLLSFSQARSQCSKKICKRGAICSIQYNHMAENFWSNC